MGALAVVLTSLAAKLERPTSRDRRPTTSGSLHPKVASDHGDLATAHPEIAAILAMPLDQFARGDQLLEVRVTWLSETLWFVPDEADAVELGRDGVSRGRVWTATELIAVMALAGGTAGLVQTLALMKCTIDGDILDVQITASAPVPTVTADGGVSRLLLSGLPWGKYVNREDEVDLLLGAEVGRLPAGARAPRGWATGR